MRDFICVRTFPNRAIAEIARGALLAEGLESSVAAEDTAYDIALASGGARLLVAADVAEKARQILGRLHADGGDGDASAPIRFPLKSLFVVTTITALAAAGFAFDGVAGGVTLPVSAVLTVIGVGVLRALEGRRPVNRFFVAVAGAGLIAYGLVHIALLLSGLFD